MCSRVKRIAAYSSRNGTASGTHVPQFEAWVCFETRSSGLLLWTNLKRVWEQRLSSRFLSSLYAAYAIDKKTIQKVRVRTDGVSF